METRYFCGKCDFAVYTYAEFAEHAKSDECLKGGNPRKSVPVDIVTPPPHPKPRFSLLPTNAIWQVAQVAEFGAVKHGEYKHEATPPFEYMNKALRHLFQAMNTELDPESGLKHVAHAALDCILALESWDNEN